MVKKLLQGYIGADLKLNLGSQTLKSVLLVPTLCCLTQAHTVEAQETQRRSGLECFHVFAVCPQANP